jgi:hypothetical protein
VDISIMNRGRDSPCSDLRVVVENDPGRKDTLFCVRHTTLFVTMENAALVATIKGKTASTRHYEARM